MPFREIAETFNLEFTETGQTGIRGFIDDPNGAFTNIPLIGEKFPLIAGFVSTRKLLARRITVSKFGGDPRTNELIVHYSTIAEDDSDITDKNIAPDKLPRSVELSADLVIIDPKGKWEWDTDESVIENEDNISITKRISIGSVSIQRVFKFVNIPLYTQLIGTVNSKVFLGAPAGIWLFGGVTADEFTNDAGDSRFRCRFNFLFRSVTGTPTDGKGWNYTFRHDTAIFDRPKVIGTGDFIYALSDFNRVFKS